MGKQEVVYLHNGMLLGNKRKEVLRHPTTQMNLNDVVLNKRHRHKRP